MSRLILQSALFKLDEGMTAETIGRAVEIFFREKKKMLAEGMTTPEGYLVQAKEEQSWKKFAGWIRRLKFKFFNRHRIQLQ